MQAMHYGGYRMLSIDDPRTLIATVLSISRSILYAKDLRRGMYAGMMGGTQRSTTQTLGFLPPRETEFSDTFPTSNTVYFLVGGRIGVTRWGKPMRCRMVGFCQGAERKSLVDWGTGVVSG